MPPRKKKMPVPERSTERIKILVPFNGMYAGDTADVVIDPTVLGWINAGLAKVVDSGADQAGPGAAVTDDSGGFAVRTGDSSASGDEPSEGFGAGGYGAFAG